MEKKKIAILGSTGSIGTQALEVIDHFSDEFEVEVLTTYSNAKLIIKQALQYRPNFVVVVENEAYLEVKTALKDEPVKIFGGIKSIADVVEMCSADIVLTAMVGFSGVLPTIKAIETRKTVALANKETLVAAGSIIMDAAKHYKTPIIPVDSEHSAIFQCLNGEFYNRPEKIILTASGGPFRGKMRSQLLDIKPEDALKHPNWSMGAKITIDSATLMNKGLEAIEAYWLFDLPAENIEVVIHPESIIHSMVQFEDGSVMAQLGMPDMRVPIQYAFTFPKRLKNHYPRIDFKQLSCLHFEQPDMETFANLRLAYEALNKGGNIPCALNAANETGVKAFLNGQIGFLDIQEVNAVVMEKIAYISQPTLDQLIETDREARKIATDVIGQLIP